MSVRVVNADVFEADLPLGEARLVYADPPYTEKDIHGYGAAPDPERLLQRMLELGAADAAFVLHTGSASLHSLLPIVERYAPRRPTYFPGQPQARIFAWVKPWRYATRRNVAFQYMWEPIIVFYGKRYRNPPDLAEPDWLCALRNHRALGAHPTQKPDELHPWLFKGMLAGAEGRLMVDLYDGTGGAAIQAARQGLDAVAVEIDPRYCQLITERALIAPAPDPVRLSVEVSPNGRPVWPTLGRGQLEPDLIDDLQPRRRGVGLRT